MMDPNPTLIFKKPYYPPKRDLRAFLWAIILVCATMIGWVLRSHWL